MYKLKIIYHLQTEDSENIINKMVIYIRCFFFFLIFQELVEKRKFLGHRITQPPGDDVHFWKGAVSYQNLRHFVSYNWR